MEASTNILVNTPLQNHFFLFTVEEVARIFRLTEAAIRRLIRVREIPAIRFGKEYRIPRQFVENKLSPITDETLEFSGFGVWKGKKYPSGEDWVSEHRKNEKRSLAQYVEDLEKE